MSGYSTSGRLGEADRESMHRIAGPLGTKSARIRALSAAGFARAQIASFLGIRYQHVRNVLGPLHAADERKSVTQINVSAPPPFGACVVDAEGRLLLPVVLLTALQAQAGDTLPWKFEDDELTLMGRDSGLRFAQKLAALKSPDENESWTEQLRAERREEAAREEAREKNG